MTGKLLDRVREHEENQELGDVGEQQYRFWTSPTALVIVMFLTLSIWRGDVLLVYPAFLIVLQKIALLVFRWAGYVLGDPLIHETIDINKGYLNLLKGYVLAFVDVGGENRNFRKQLIAAALVYYQNAQLHCLALYFRIRQRKMMESVLKNPGR
jgi:hypothetical protein